MTVTVFGEADAATLAQAERCALEAEAMLLMADNHKGYGMPVGGVAVYKDKVPPAGENGSEKLGHGSGGMELLRAA